LYISNKNENLGDSKQIFLFSVVVLQQHHFNLKKHGSLQHAVEIFHGEMVEIPQLQYTESFAQFSLHKIPIKLPFGIYLRSMKTWVTYSASGKVMLDHHPYRCLMQWMKLDKHY
jgi:hypothetical protein